MKPTRLMIVGGLALAAFGSFAACPTSVPDGLSSEPVGEQLVVNGLPLRIHLVTSKAPRAELLERIEREWKDAEFDVRRARTGEWEVLSARDEDCLTTLQLIDRNGAYGFFGISRPPTAREASIDKRSSVRLPSGIKVESSVASVDSSRRGYTVAFSSRRAADDIDAYFKSQLDREGWKALSSHEVRSGAMNRARILTGQKGREQVSIVLWEDGTTHALLNVWESL